MTALFRKKSINPLHGVVSGEGPSILLIHGVAGSHRVFDSVMPLLDPHLRALRLDLLGYGHSDKPHATYSPTTHVDAIHEAVKHYGLQQPFLIVGLSMGVDLVLEYARRWPEEITGLVGIGTCYYRNEQEARSGLQKNTWTRESINHPLRSRLLIPPIWWLGRHSSALSRRFATIYTPEMAKDAMLNPYYVFRSSLFNTMVRNPLDPLLDASAAFDRLFIHGSKDKWSPVDAFRDAVKRYDRSSFLELAGVEHNVAVLEPEKIATAIIEFAETLEPKHS